MISVFGWPDPNTAFDQPEHALYTCYFMNKFPKQCENQCSRSSLYNSTAANAQIIR